jgi:hypothetical protein
MKKTCSKCKTEKALNCFIRVNKKSSRLKSWCKECSNKNNASLKFRPYRIWASLKQRCKNKKIKSYKSYGDRGITYCNKWETFLGFWDDMMEGYDDSLQIDRIDNNKGYYKENCRWVTSAEQQKNKRNVKLFDFHGKFLCLSEISRIIGIKFRTLHARIYDYGWDFEKAIMK